LTEQQFGLDSHKSPLDQRFGTPDTAAILRCIEIRIAGQIEVKSTEILYCDLPYYSA
jgi:hypothetical protein